MNAAKKPEILIAFLVAVALSGMSFFAVLGDGENVLRAISVGLLAGLAGFLGTVWIASVLSDMGK